MHIHRLSTVTENSSETIHALSDGCHEKILNSLQTCPPLKSWPLVMLPGLCITLPETQGN